MYKPVQHCDHCGANLTLDDLRGTQCPYCKVVYPHHSQAQQHVQVIGQVMGQMMQGQTMQGQTMHRQGPIQSQWRGAFGVPPIAPPPGGSPGSPYYDPNQMMQAHMQHAQQMSRRITTIILVATIGGFVLVAAIVALTMIL